VSDEPEWVRHAIWWHIYPLGFTGADTTGADRQPAHRLPHIVDYLDYAVRLGASGIALGPIFDATSHGYDTIDHYRMDPRLGDDADFERLIAEAHQRGLRVLLDGVFNQVGREFPVFARLRAGDPSAPADWFVTDGTGDPGYATFEGHPGLVTLNHANPAVADHVTEVMVHWLDRGADGWRLDAAYAVPPPFWADVLARVRAAHPGAYLVGEVIHGDYAAFVRATGMHSVTQYELWKAIWSSINDRNLFELAWALDRHATWLETFVPFTFVGNHDVTRLASRLVDQRHLAHALVVLLTVAGTPAIYYGDERAWTGDKEHREGGDDAVRPAYPEHPALLPGDEEPTLRLHQDLIGLRRRHPWLHCARTVTVHLANQQMVYDATDGTRRLRILLNLGDAALRHDPVDGPVLAGAATLTPEATVVAAHGWAIAQLAGSPRRGG
jgi:cyclomaltodextrinase